jgi:hypothetical protein
MFSARFGVFERFLPDINLPAPVNTIPLDTKSLNLFRYLEKEVLLDTVFTPQCNDLINNPAINPSSGTIVISKHWFPQPVDFRRYRIIVLAEPIFPASWKMDAQCLA